jgi:hypothetical protein
LIAEKNQGGGRLKNPNSLSIFYSREFVSRKHFFALYASINFLKKRRFSEIKD